MINSSNVWVKQDTSNHKPDAMNDKQETKKKDTKKKDTKKKYTKKKNTKKKILKKRINPIILKSIMRKN